MKSLVLLFLTIELALTYGQSSDIVGELVVGYQGWFGAPNDGSPIVNKWLHWALWGETPSPGHVTFEIYPDTREYQKLYQTGLGNLGNGQPAKLFSAWDISTVDVHFKWMQQYNIQTVALQVGVVYKTNKTIIRAVSNHFQRIPFDHSVFRFKSLATRTLPTY